MRKRKELDRSMRRVIKQVEMREAYQTNSFGFVDRDWDCIEDTESEFAERLRTRGSF